MSTSPERGQVEAAAAALAGGLYTEPALAAAAALLADLYAAGARHGVAPTRWGGVTHLPQACVMVTGYRDTVPHTGQAAAVLLERLVEQLRGRGIDTARHALRVPVPVVAPGELRRLAVTITLDAGWCLVWDVEGSSAVATVVAPHDAAGAAAVAEAVLAVARGQRPNPLPGGEW
ncbi:MAG: hypothetical protein ACRDT0_02515 [Pseudonocardiaceae bacterium]